jgi:putative glycosyltransferase (TIGR04348 family)
MRIRMICPAPPGSRFGNRVTAQRWARLLRKLGHRVEISTLYRGEPCDILIALHAKRSAAAAHRFRERYPRKPLIVALTGTDVYRDIHRYAEAQRTLELADRLVALQPGAILELPGRLRFKARVIYQSVAPSKARARHRADFFDVCVLGHLRDVKDPLRAAFAARLLPAESRIRVIQAGQAMEHEMAKMARAEARRNPRYRWVGEIPRWQARRLIRSSRLMVLSSRMEGGANVISEAVVEGVPVLASRISGSVGLLGKDYPGYFPVGDTKALARLLRRAESDPRFYACLRSHCSRLAPLFRPAREQAAWQKLLTELKTPAMRTYKSKHGYKPS